MIAAATNNPIIKLENWAANLFHQGVDSARESEHVSPSLCARKNGENGYPKRRLQILFYPLTLHKVVKTNCELLRYLPMGKHEMGKEIGAKWKMKSKRTWGWVVAVVMLLSGASLLTKAKANNNSNQEANLPGLMLAKLASTQRVVTGLVSKNFGEIKRGAKDMMSICDASQWESHPDPLYGHYREELRRQASSLSDHADHQNLDGAAFSYIQTISACFSCHAHCRDILRIAAVPNRVIQIPVVEGEFERSGMPIYRR